MVRFTSEEQLRRFQYLLQLAGVFVAYFVGGKIGLAVPFTHTNVSALWPPAGIALAAVLLWGHRMWPAIALGAFLVNFLTAIPPLASLGITFGNTAAALIGGYLVRRNPRFDPALLRISDVLRFILLGAASTAVSATNGVLVLSAASLHPWSSAAFAWFVWWLGDTMGVLIVAPLMLGLATRRDLLRGRSIVEAAILVSATALAAFVIFDRRVIFAAYEDFFAFFLVPFVIWGATRFGTAGSAAVMAVIAAIAVWQSALGAGPFVHAQGIFQNAVVLQFFLAVVSVTGLILAAVICERDTAEETLRRRQELQRQTELLETITRNATAGLLMIDVQSRCTFMNPAAERITGFSFQEMKGRMPHEVLHHTRPDGSPYPASECPLNRALPLMQPVQDLEEVFIHKQGHFYPVRCSARPIVEQGVAIGTVWEVQDMSRQKKTEQALLESEKLALMGRTAAVIAHEINNPLAAITNLVYLLQKHPTLDRQAREYVMSLMTEVARVGQITKQTLGFYRGSKSPVPLKLAQVADEALESCTKALKSKGVSVTRQYRSNGEMRGYPVELRQVFVNLISNAIEAVHPGGNICIEVSEAPTHDRPAVRVVVSDDGTGIPDELKTQIFEPFFSTKGEQGTGLGLWVTRSIVYKHEGSIEVTSNNNAGAAFSIVLPKAVA
jgi:PAS domain S-box-containing protein